MPKDDLDALRAENERLRRRIEILETPPCFSCGAVVTDACPRERAKACGREHLGGSRSPIRWPKGEGWRLTRTGEGKPAFVRSRRV